MYRLMEKDHKWLWTKECHNALLKCKEMLTSKAVLAHYDSTKPLKLACDASAYELGAVLSHTLDDGEYLIVFNSFLTH